MTVATTSDCLETTGDANTCPTIFMTMFKRVQSGVIARAQRFTTELCNSQGPFLVHLRLLVHLRRSSLQRPNCVLLDLRAFSVLPASVIACHRLI